MKHPIALGLTAVAALVVAGLAAGPLLAATEVARVGGKVITLEDLDSRARRDNIKAYQAFYDARRQVLEKMIADLLIEKEAKARGITSADLVKSEVTDKVKPVTDEDITSWYEKNKNRVRNQPLEKVQSQIRRFLTNQRRGGAYGTFIESLKKKTPVRVFLEPPRVDVALGAGQPSSGPEKAPVVLVEFSDYQ